MPRTTVDAPITTKAARERLPIRAEPYWRGVEAGIAVGYRRGTRGGTWLARLLDGTKYREERLGRADDALPANGADYLDFRQAQTAAVAWAARRRRIAAGLEPEPSKVTSAPYTVADALRDHLADLQVRGSRGVTQTRTSAEAHIIPGLGPIAVGRLSREKVGSWFRAMAASPARLRSRPGTPQRFRAVDLEDEDGARRRRATANRILTILKAALNHARQEGRATCPPDAWQLVKPFRNADAPKVRFLTDQEAVRLVNACPTDFRALVTAALLTGCRYGEIAAIRPRDLDLAGGTVVIPRSKSGKARHVVLTREGVAFFRNMSAGTAPEMPIFQRAGMARQATRDAPVEMRRVPWSNSDQFRPMAKACEAAGIVPAISFHILRHTHASRLARAGVPLSVIATQLGHADTRMTERHYAHLAPSYVAETIRAHFTDLGLAAVENIKSV
jgi:integrase